MKKTKITLIAPFWGQTSHVGNLRVERMMRWLTEANCEVVLLRAGTYDRSEEFTYGTLVTVRDPLNLYSDNAIHRSTPSSGRKPNALRRQIAFWLFNPDPSIVWARRVCRHPLAVRAAQESSFIIASSPPESGHVLAWRLARRLGGAPCIDLRDGWLDEPLKTYLLKPGFRTWREAQLEKKILSSAHSVFVTSLVWKKLLEERLPFTRGKTVLMTNTYPNEILQNADSERTSSESEHVSLIYAGQFSQSRPTQDPAQLWNLLLKGIKTSTQTGKIVVYGSIPEEEMPKMKIWQTHFQGSGWSIDFKKRLPRPELLKHLKDSHGLLLLSSTHAPIPSKIFEYIPLGLPILCVTPPGSAVWEMGSRIRQIVLANPHDPQQSLEACKKFLKACGSPAKEFDIPEEYSETVGRRIFLDKLGIQIEGGIH